MPEYIDIHSHLNFENFDTDREEVIARLKAEKIWSITVGTTVEDSRSAIALAEKHHNLFATVGIHPTHEWTEKDFEEIERLASHQKVVAIGECGLDFFHLPREASAEIVEQIKMRQGLAFARHIEISLKNDKPLMIHCRNAYQDALSVLKTFKTDHKLGDRLRGNMHFFAGDLETAKKFLEIGFTLSFAGPITFAKDYDEVIKHTPIDRIMSETDAPFAAPMPYRGKRNEPGYVKEIVKKIAETRGDDPELIKQRLVSNAIETFNLPKF